PVWLPLSKQFFKEHGCFEGDQLIQFVRLCFEEDHREVHYLAIEMVQQQIKQQAASFIDFLEEMILKKSWWDSVDWISKLVNIHFQRYPEQVCRVTARWMESNSIWLQRVAIIFQRYSKTATDEQLLFDYILQVADTKEFFLQKGAGWALRDYSKVNPQAVIDFVADHNLPALTKREGLRWLKKKGHI
ncbi:MAG: DNA alkylation repair protein, partial [Bacteroidota bacterium]